ncbi:MAG TPA: carboxypeptidase-like regulatory domain-containing protein, partial [Salegentibacter sp.]|nr:carboxypeptidase-like regulatory domain-containing protein [Salegentibacter sp.]
MNRKLNSILTLLLVLIAHITFAQQKTISGNVTDQDGLPLPGVNVLLKGTSTGTQTDFDGNYSIQAAQGDVLVFSFIGMEKKEYTVGAVNTIDVTLGSDSASLDEVVVVAYGTSSQAAFTGSANVIGSAELEQRNVTSPIAAIEGKATGVQFTSPAGPGESPGIVIRGVG